MIGILGGTFDPIHYGHLRPAFETRRALSLDLVHIIPAGTPPHRPAPIADPGQRLRMVELALAEFPGLIVDDREIRRPGPSYTVQTLESLRAEIGRDPLCLLMGTDAFYDLESWYQWQRLPELAHIVVMQRPGWPISAVPRWARDRVRNDARELLQRSSGYVIFQQVTPQDISATRIREAVARNEPVDQWIPVAVWEYIRAEGLYRNRGE